LNDRKKDHIELAFQSQMGISNNDERFYYEPVLSAHPENSLQAFSFLGKKMKVPIWVSSMTGGTEKAYHINKNLARACREFGMGLGLGSCRSILDDEKHFGDFDLRDEIGGDLPFYANLGISQVEQLIREKKTDLVLQLVGRLRADGLIIHINPIQEWLQPEGDTLQRPPIETIEEFLGTSNIPLIIKEVGQGMGPLSLQKLLGLPLAAVEYGAFGGTNFANLEMMREADSANSDSLQAIAGVGHTAVQMTEFINNILKDKTTVRVREVIISGGIKNFLDGYYLINKIQMPAIYGMGSQFLKYAMKDYASLKAFILTQIQGLKIAYSYLKIKE